MMVAYNVTFYSREEVEFMKKMLICLVSLLMLIGCDNEKENKTDAACIDDDNTVLPSSTLSPNDVEGVVYYDYNIRKNKAEFFGEKTPFTYQLSDGVDSNSFCSFRYFTFNNNAFIEYGVYPQVDGDSVVYNSEISKNYKIIEIGDRYFVDDYELVIGKGILYWGIGFFATEEYLNKNNVELKTVHTHIEELVSSAKIKKAKTELFTKINSDLLSPIVNKNETYELPKSIEIMYEGEKCIINVAYTIGYSLKEIVLNDNILTFVDGNALCQLDCTFTCSNGYDEKFSIIIGRS